MPPTYADTFFISWIILLADLKSRDLLTGFPQHLENLENLENDERFSSHGNIMEFWNFTKYHGKMRRNLEKCEFQFKLTNVLVIKLRDLPGLW